MHVVAVVAPESVVAFDLAAPVQVFGCAESPGGEPLYEVRVCAAPRSRAGVGRTELFAVSSPWGLVDLLDADTVVVAGTVDVRSPTDDHLLDLLRRAADRGARLASICVGAFSLAAAGLLDGRRATTHWRWAGELARRHPAVRVDPDVLFVDEGPVLTSAGIAAGLDLCLHMVRRDHGAAVALGTARNVVMPLQRDGGQAQFIAHPDPVDPGSLRPVLEWMERHLDRPLPLHEIADHAALSVRSLNRRFRQQAGTSPQEWLRRARVRRAQQLLETTDLPVERIAAVTGFGSAPSLRAHFNRQVGTSPAAYRRAFTTRDARR